MYEVMKSVSFCYGHRLLDYDGKCANLHGHNARADIVLRGDKLDDRGILFDFTAIHSTAKKWIDENLDHILLLRKDDPVIAALDDLDETYFVMDDNPTAENIARLIYDYMRSQDFPVERVRLWETDTCFAVYSAG